MEKKRIVSFCPAGISSFFEICDKNKDGNIITYPEKIGARGGGFSPKNGVTTEALLDEAEKNQIQIFINGKSFPKAETTKWVVNSILKRVSKKYLVIIKHDVQVPIGAGFGSSAAGALGTVLAVSKALNLNLTYNQLGKIAHIAEVKCKTGLGTVGPLLFGGCGLTIEPGAPGIAILDRIPVSPDYRLIVGTFNPYSTTKMLSKSEKRIQINEWGKKTLDNIIDNPSLENFLSASKTFALKTGLATSRVQKLIEQSENSGAVGAAQNMLGEAVHALVKNENIDSVYATFLNYLPKEKIIIADIDHQGARIIG